ncbi:MAG: hypothetical protein EAX96_21165 [Candidatus Lokiarchaeota archaeon]|nr:hypothetical protein [Candidatus Lokiarchaeota archaeon]
MKEQKILIIILILLTFLILIPETRATPSYHQLYPTTGEYDSRQVNNGTWFGWNLSGLVKIIYQQDNFKVGYNLTFYCQNVKTGVGLMRIMFLNSINYAAYVASQSYMPLAEILCDDIPGAMYEDYGHLSYNITTIDNYYLVIQAFSTDTPILSLDYKTGFIGELETSPSTPADPTDPTTPTNPNTSFYEMLSTIIITVAIIGIILVIPVIIYAASKAKKTKPVPDFVIKKIKEEKIDKQKEYQLPLNCPKCNAPINSENIKTLENKAKCLYCDSIFYLEEKST